MTSSISAVVVHDEGLGADAVRKLLPPESGVDIVDIGNISSDITRLVHEPADVLVIACATRVDDTLELIRWWGDERSGIPVVVLSRASVNGFVREAFEAGVDDLVVVAPGSEDQSSVRDAIAFTLRKAVVRGAGPRAEKSAGGQLVCVLGPKGGIGKTLTSCNLAVCLADAEQKVCLVDLDLQFGDTALSLDISPSTTVYDLVAAGGTLDEEKVDSYLIEGPSGLKMLLSPLRPDQAGAISVDFLRDLYVVLRKSFDYVVVDTPPGFTPEVIATIDASSSIVMLGMLDALSLKNTRLGLETLDLMGYDHSKIRLVLNRADSNVGITHNDVVSILGRSPDILIPSTREITRAVNAGQPIVLTQRKSEAAKAFFALADLYMGRTAEAPERKARSLLNRRHG